MKKSVSFPLIPCCTLVCSLAGFFLCRKLFDSGFNSHGLLLRRNPLPTVLIALSLVLMATMIFLVRRLPKTAALSSLLPHHPIRAAGNYIGAIGILWSALQSYTPGHFLGLLSLVLGVLAALALLVIGSQRILKMDPHYLLYGILTVFFMLCGLNRCRGWSTLPQATAYLFPLLAQVALLLTGYEYTVLCGESRNVRSFTFCSQMAVFFCLTAFAADFDMLYLGCALWLILDGAFFHSKKEE